MVLNVNLLVKRRLVEVCRLAEEDRTASDDDRGRVVLQVQSTILYRACTADPESIYIAEAHNVFTAECGRG
jgi:hypothetical protein